MVNQYILVMSEEEGHFYKITVLQFAVKGDSLQSSTMQENEPPPYSLSKLRQQAHILICSLGFVQTSFALYHYDQIHLIISLQIQAHVHLRQQVCGAPGDAPCGESPCGGAGCRDDDGNRHCGGLNCNSAVAVADNALERAKLAEKELNKAIGEVEELFSKVWGHMKPRYAVCLDFSCSKTASHLSG